MGKSQLVLRSLLVTGAAIAVTTLGSMSASAATTPTLSASPACKVPAMTLSSTTAAPGTKITVSGKNFSGCTVAGSTAKATPVLTVKVGVLTAAKVQDLLATTKTQDGSFSVQITVPKVSAGGEPKIAVAAVSEDPATKLVYHATQTITYKTATTTSAAPTPTASSPAPTSASASTAASSSSQDVPTAVPAGSGGMGGTTGTTQIAVELGLGAAGVALLGAGGISVARRRARQH